jgi:hypothetical protein
MSAKPWKDHRDSAANGLSGREMAVLAKEQERRAARILEMGGMGAVQIDAGLRERRGHEKLEQVTGALLEDSGPRDFQLAKSSDVLTHRAILEVAAKTATRLALFCVTSRSRRDGSAETTRDKRNGCVSSGYRRTDSLIFWLYLPLRFEHCNLLRPECIPAPVNVLSADFNV